MEFCVGKIPLWWGDWSEASTLYMEQELLPAHEPRGWSEKLFGMKYHKGNTIPKGTNYEMFVVNVSNYNVHEETCNWGKVYQTLPLALSKPYSIKLGTSVRNQSISHYSKY